jgi:hypothetical protein
MDIKDLKIIYECITGSHSYGTSTPESDTDYAGIAIAPLDCYLGTAGDFENLVQHNPDRTIYDIRKFLRLAVNCNPNIIELLWTGPENIVSINSAGLQIRENRDLFLSKKARYTFLGYAFAQLKRIRTHRNWLLHPVERKPTRVDFGLPEFKLIRNDHQEAFIWMFSRIMQDSLEEAKLSSETREELQNVNVHGLLQSKIPEELLQPMKLITGATDEFISSLAKERSYRAALQEWDSFQGWKKTRNPKRAELEAKCGYDSKCAMMLVRLAKMGEEILSGKGVIVKRPDAEELLEIRNGNWSFEKVEEFATGMDKKMDELYKISTLPHSPDESKVNQLCVSILEKELNGTSRSTTS